MPQRRTKKRRTTRSSQPLVMYRQPIARKLIVPMRYCETLTLNPGVGGLMTYNAYAANGIYDPNITGAGHQPMGHDEYATLYKKYRVLSSHITVEFFPEGASGLTDNVICVIMVNQDTSLPSSPQTAIENGDSVYGVATDSDNNGRLKLKNNWSSKRYSGSIADHQAQMGSANPTNLDYFHVGCGSLNGEDPSEVNCLVTISYQVLLTEPNDLLGS